jgi:hypothetical protein
MCQQIQIGAIDEQLAQRQGHRCCATADGPA